MHRAVRHYSPAGLVRRGLKRFSPRYFLSTGLIFLQPFVALSRYNGYWVFVWLPKMRALSTREEILVTEQVVLRSLCQRPFASAQRMEILRILAGYTWKSGEHQILFEVLHQLQIDSAERLRQQLPAILTRKGFPDVDSASYFAASATTLAQALNVARKLAARTHGEP